jgi:hypothetical protein
MKPPAADTWTHSARRDRTAGLPSSPSTSHGHEVRPHTIYAVFPICSCLIVRHLDGYPLPTFGFIGDIRSIR